ncbi:hypothetical protein [Nocardia fusca]|uniref:hypothetical protein n=1 Tax=Nocardia fusca TaxID=941183 RepID=UPI0012F4F8C2|nr:hypothetical protein [Nocardia fusca]
MWSADFRYRNSATHRTGRRELPIHVADSAAEFGGHLQTPHFHRAAPVADIDRHDGRHLALISGPEPREPGGHCGNDARVVPTCCPQHRFGGLEPEFLQTAGQATAGTVDGSFGQPRRQEFHTRPRQFTAGPSAAGRTDCRDTRFRKHTAHISAVHCRTDTGQSAREHCGTDESGRREPADEPADQSAGVCIRVTKNSRHPPILRSDNPPGGSAFR